VVGETPPEIVIRKMSELGFFKFWLPYTLTTALFYGLLTKSRIFGDPQRNVAVNAVVSLVAAFMVWAAPILVGIDVERQLSLFFLQAISGMLMLVVGVMMSSVFFGPDLPKQLSEKFKGGGLFGAILFVGVLVGLAILFSSGLVNVFYSSQAPGTPASLPQDIIVTVIMLIMMGIIIAGIVMAK